MKQSDYASKELLYKCEVLRARLEIRNFFLKTCVREIYENIGQILSHVRMQLALNETQEINAEKISSCGDLIGQTIKDLRAMCRSFYPDEDILKEGGFVEGLKNVMTILGMQPVVQIKGKAREISQSLQLFVFEMLQEVLASVKEIRCELDNISIAYGKSEILFFIDYNGTEVQLGMEKIKDEGSHHLSFNNRLQLIKGNLHVRKFKAGKTKITFKVPLNIVYE